MSGSKKAKTPDYAPHCYKRLRRHNFRERRVAAGQHLWKRCVDCGAMRRTHHVSCSAGCWGGIA